MGRVRVLPENLVNKIAAGEVIERPASVLKELVENSLDAGATRIDIALEAGGRQLVRVTDDGVGMDGDDLALAVQPHATSKLADESDLFALHTMGFRGEALPSIGSVSQMRITTRPGGSDQGFALEINGGQIGAVSPAAAAQGTTIEVRNLFFNTPARRKFLKADSTEIGHLSEALARIALSCTEVHFRMTHNGRLAYDLPPTTDLSQRVADFFGRELADTLIPVEQPASDDQSPAVRGLIALPQHSRASAKWQYIFLNGRYIRDRFIQHALREAYRGLMESSRQPVVFLYLLLPPELVDVNVHPTKIEVRFADSNRVHSAVLRCLRDRLTRADLTARGALGRDESGDREPPLAALPAPDPAEDEQTRQQRIREAMADFFRSKRAEPVQRRMVFEPDDRRALTPAPRNPAAPVAPGSQTAAPGPDARDIPNPEFRIPHSPPGPVLQVHNTYLVMPDADGLLIIDQHALHERIIYESLYARLTDGPTGRLQSQPMLIPQRVTLGARPCALLLEHAELLARLGLELTRFGRDEVAICAFPSLLAKADPAAFLADLADKLADEPPTGPEEFVHDVLDMMACKAAVKAGDPLSPAEIDALLAQRETAERAGSCPHGRPTTLRFSLAELERQFHRR